MTFWLLLRGLRRAPRRFALEALGIAFPVAMLAATLIYVDGAVQDMTPIALRPVQVEMRGVAKSLGVDMGAVAKELATAPNVSGVERFASMKVVVTPGGPGNSGSVTARLFAVDPSYLTRYPWVHVVSGSLEPGALLDQGVLARPGFEGATSVSIGLPGDAPPLDLTLPVGGTVDLRQARTWFALPTGETQGDIVTVPRAIVVDYPTFERAILPVLQQWQSRGGLPPFDPGAGELPAASLETHIAIDHTAYPADPHNAGVWSARLQRLLERRAGGSVVIADNAAEELLLSQQDATNAKILFLLLGIPGVLVAAGLGLAASSFLVEAQRREWALLRLRGATAGQIARAAVAQATVAGGGGSAVGLAVAIGAVSLVVGRAAWRGIPGRDLVVAVVLAVAAGALTTVVRAVRLRRTSRQAEIVRERRLLEGAGRSLWWRTRFAAIAIAAGIVILAVNAALGGLKPTPVEGTGLALAFYVLLAPIALWLGTTLFAIRGVMSGLARWARPDRSGPLSSWPGAWLRWLGRRPAQAMVSLALGALAVAFGANVLAFAATYDTAKRVDAEAALGADLRLTPGTPRSRLPDLGPAVAAVSPVRVVSARVGSNRKSILAIELPSYLKTASMSPRLVDGQGAAGLAKEPQGVLVNREIADNFSVGVGDPLPVTIFPDDFENSKNLQFRIVGVFNAFPPTSPPTELVALTSSLPRADLVPPDFYLARVAPGRSPGAVAATLRSGALANTFGVTTAGDPTTRGLTALNVVGLGRIETVAAGLIAALGVAILGSFLVLERRREFAVLRSVGAETRQVLVGPTLEGALVAIGSLVIGMPIGLGLGILGIRVLGLFFAVPPPLVTLPTAELLGLALFVVLTSAIAIAGALIAVNRVGVASVLKEA